MTDSERKIIDRLKKSGKAVLFCYAPDYATGTKNYVSAISRITGINVIEKAENPGMAVFDGEK